MASPVLQNAIETVKRAIEADRAGNLELALSYYTRALTGFFHEMKYTTSAASKETMRSRCASYMSRAEAIKEALGTASVQPEAAPAAHKAVERDDAPFDLQAELAARIGMADVKRQLLELEHTLAVDARLLEHEAAQGLARRREGPCDRESSGEREQPRHCSSLRGHRLW